MTRPVVSSPFLLALVVGAALAGAAIGFVLGGASTGSTAHAAGDDGVLRSVDRRPSNAHETSELSQPVSSNAASRTQQAPLVRATLDLDPARIDRAVSAAGRGIDVDRPTGEGAIEGTVLSREGVPIPGVDVLLLPARSPVSAARSSSSDARPDDVSRSLEAALREAAEQWAGRDGLSVRTSTDARGGFAFRDLADGRYEIRAQAEGWSFTVNGPRIVVPGESVSLEGRPTHAVVLELRAKDGSAVDNALLRLSLTNGREWVEWTAAEPRLHVDVPQFQVRAYADLFDVGRDRNTPAARLVSDLIGVDAAAEGGQTVVLELETRSILVGRLIGDPVGGGENNTIFAVPLREGEVFDPTVRLSGSLSTWAQSGSFVFESILPGAYEVGILDENEMPVNHVRVDIVDGWNELTLERHDADLSNSIAVRALSPGGTRIESVSYALEVQQEGSDPDSLWVSVRRNVDGADLLGVGRLDSFDYDAWPPGARVWLKVESNVYGSKRVALSSGQRAVDVRFDVPCELEVAIEGDISIGGYTVVVLEASIERDDPPELASARQSGRSGGVTQIGPSGTCRFRGLAAGPVTVALRLSPRRWGQGVEVARQEIVLTGKDHRVQFQAIPLCDLNVVITPPGQDRYFSLRQDRENGETETLGWGRATESGRLTFRGVPPGDYTVFLAESGARLDVTLPSGEIRWDLSEHVIKVSISLTRADGQLAAWGLVGGDLLTSIDGEPIEDTEQLLRKLDADEVTVTVERGDETFELKIPRYPRETRARNPIGGWFEIAGG